MPCSTPPFAFTQLVEPSTYASPNAVPAGFNAAIADLMGQCCNLTYWQYQTGQLTIPPSQLAMLGNFQQLASFTVSEDLSAARRIGSGAGLYKTDFEGFALTGTPSSGGPAINIIALRGTRTTDEWINDAEAVPVFWLQGNNNGQNYNDSSIFTFGMVHGGFYNFYNQGTNGAAPARQDAGAGQFFYTRASGSIAQQIQALVQGGTFNPKLPLYVTGHSLGAALATLCAMDIGVNFPASFPAGQLYMYNLASPLVAAGVVGNVIAGALPNFPVGVAPGVFVSAYNAVVAKSYRVVNSADIVPILPPSCLALTKDVNLEFAQVTKNVVTFGAQMGSIGGNHACVDTYSVYLGLLAQNFSTVSSHLLAS